MSNTYLKKTQKTDDLPFWVMKYCALKLFPMIGSKFDCDPNRNR